MTYMAIALSMLMAISGGIGIDMIYTELQRTKVQNTLDRAVLAAADLDNELDPETVVLDYMDKMSLGGALSDIDVDEGLNYRVVTADAAVTMPSNVLKLIGIDTLAATAHAQAEERLNKVEISLVLDISGSMDDYDKLENMQNAAGEFVDTMLIDGNEDLVSISVVPYSEHVNAGPEILSFMNVDWMHGYSHCIEMPNSVFDTTTLDLGRQWEQMQHYQFNYSAYNDRSDTVCPRYDYERIRPWSQDARALKQQIGQLQPRAGTSIFLGMKWATALLDPSTRPIASGMIRNGSVDDAFEGRPLDYDNEEVLKTVVLMTDGKNDRSHRIRDWAYDSESEYAHWNRYNLQYFLNHRVYNYRPSDYYYEKYNAQTGDALLSSICSAAKDQGILIWTIGFEVEDHGADVMRACASSPSHFFRVNGIEISDAFSTIARTINQLRLTQ
ncbi:hypothetical protein GCM10011415_33130 [Salipiger pallidus]|uniref:VWFA domain-containing protein n=1 Tax=Salipiger pallidus TaxID=1775170 RepID=A0A8J3EHV9_9RHOB|nr:Tad domain-containing protein [Salipiger pallidus]GGG81021.1 hypothetical protein GCM10011415_33130 [Salipiger pallidus]